MALRIKQNVDLKELEKYGFKKEHWGYIYYPNENSPQTRYFSSIKIDNDDEKNGWLSKTIRFCFENMSTWCNDLEQLDLDFENIKYSYNEFKKIIDILKENNIVEEVEDI